MAGIRVGGLASGMDIDSIVKDMMKVERMPLDKMEQEKQILEWKQEDYRSINTLLLDFRSELTQMNMTTSYRSRTVSTSDESKVTATASSAASLSSYNISSVSQIATAATLRNVGSISSPNSEKVDLTKGLFSQRDKFAVKPENWENSREVWKQGIIERKDFTSTVDENKKVLSTIEFDIETVPDSSMSIRVDGKGYKVVRDKEVSELAKNEVLYTPADGETPGELTFADGVLKENSKVRAEYIVDSKTDTTTISEPIERWRLSKQSIADEAFTLQIGEGNTFTIKEEADNEFHLVDTSGSSIGTINKETGLINFNQDKLKDIIPDDSDVEIKATYQQNYTDFTLGAHTSEGETHETFLVSGNTSINQVMSSVNSSQVGLTMFYDSFTDQMTLSRNETGNFNGEGANEFDGKSVTGLNNREIITDGLLMNSLFRFGNGTETGGQNAKFTINELTTERHSNTFDISGVTFSLKKTFTEDEEAATLSVNNDSEAVFENIKEFVENYNTLIEAINDKLTEDVHRSYKPLTDQEREELSDKQQEKWEEMARSGLLRGDSTLSGALSSMRSDFYAPVDNPNVSGSYDQLAKIGITTTRDWMSGGKLEINEAKLKAAIEDDPASVENLFRGNGDTKEEQGITRRLYDSVNQTMDKIYERAGRSSYSNNQFTIGRNIENVDDQISRFQDRLTQIEDRYWRQFTAMEKAIQQANSQMSYMMQQFGGY
ncbi:flagellar filament capping protein FliD [Ornithinibacillus halophilus]|uniref:Flagellar hook-associated protein 2 n=1 Tax=Ornithinibacillus halophilus TaxID=930117 RepID=A0A1M5FFX9_9BACI|nr:flagellar filament capping protein FliD [Ornithinibacillus halophilus]SHF90396.1 flagellar hook-associated protein 2 [Ornithinibacillus halophilus]